jgi:hypothetical protein
MRELAGGRGGFLGENTMTAVLLSDQKTFALVDAADIPLMEGIRWHPRRHGTKLYVRAKIGRDWVYLHRFLLNPDRGLVVDHIDGNPLNNTRANLRIVTQKVNLWNFRASREVGVSRKGEKWRARIRHNGKRIELGFYQKRHDAFAAYDTAVMILRDGHAYRNGSYPVAEMASFPPTARKILTEACQ